MRLVKAARLTQNITVATATVVPDSAPRPSEQAPEPCKRLSGLSGRRLRRKQTAPGRSSRCPSRVFASSRRGRGCGGSSSVPRSEAVPARPLGESTESRPAAGASATCLGRSGCGLGSVSDTPQGTPALLGPARASMSSPPGSPAFLGSERQPASRPHTLIPHVHPELEAEVGLCFF